MTDLGTIYDTLRDATATIALTPIERITRLDLNELGFASIQVPIASVHQLLSVLHKCDVTLLPPALVGPALIVIEPMVDILTQMRDFNLLAISTARENPQAHHEMLINHFREQQKGFFDRLAPTIALAASLHGLRAIGPSDEAIQQLLTTGTDAIAILKRQASEATSLLQTARDASAKIGVAKYAGLFSGEASEYAKTARAWLSITAILSLMTFGVVALNLALALGSHSLWFTIIFGKIDEVAWHSLAAKILTVTVLISATIWCGRQYRAAKHNEILNRHRHAALESFETFAKAAGDDLQTKNAVLLHAAQAIFAPQSSGFVVGEPDSAPQILELVRTIAPGSKN